MKTILWLIWPLLILAGLLIYRYTSGEKYGAGKALYAKHCASCHMEDGSGLRGVIPPLAMADYVNEHAADMACLIRYGMEGEIVVNGRTYNSPMYGHADIKDVEIRNIINYIKNAWGNEGEEIAFKDIEAALESCPDTVAVPTP